MSLVDKLGQVAGKVGEACGDTFDYGKAKGKIVLERGKIKDVKEAIGEYVYNAVKESGEIDKERIMAFCAEIDEHIVNIENFESEAKQSGENLSGTFRGKDRE